MKGLIIKPNWADLILDGIKNLELRGHNTTIRGTIGIIKSGTKMIYGTVDLIDCIILNEDKFYKMINNHQFKEDFNNIKYKNLYGWVLENPLKFENPIPYEHKLGCVIWVNI